VIACSVEIASLEKGEGKELNKMKEALIRRADSPMYRSKDLRKNRVTRR
jgi:GGDEF domain-containing protein